MEYYFDYVTDTQGLLDQLDSWDDVDVDAWLEQSQESREERLEQELAEIREQLEGRDELHGRIVDELEWYVDRLEKLYTHGIGRTDGKRERLQDQIEAFYREWRREQREHWQDRQQLEQERRAVLREVEAATDESVSDVFDSIDTLR